MVNSLRQPLNGYYLGALLLLIRFTFWSRFSFHLSYDFHVWLPSLTVSTEWFFNPFIQWIAQDSEYSQGQKNKMKRDGINR